MIQGFEEQTKAINPKEFDNLLVKVVEILATRRGSRNAISNGRIRTILKSKGVQVKETQIRKIINCIRNSGIIENLIANSSGYFIATSRADVAEYLMSLDGRIGAIAKVKNSLETQMLNIW